MTYSFNYDSMRTPYGQHEKTSPALSVLEFQLKKDKPILISHLQKAQASVTEEQCDLGLVAANAHKLVKRVSMYRYQRHVRRHHQKTLHPFS